MKQLLIATLAAIALSGSAFAGSMGGSSSANINLVSGSQTQAADVSSVSDASNAGNTQTTAATGVDGGINITIDQGDTTDRSIPTQSFTDSTSTADTKIKYSGEYKVKNTPNVVAPGLVTTMTETCMGSSSAGAAVPGFGISFGTTWRDSACVRRLDARQLQALGYTLGAKELMCDSPAVRAALKRAGKPCFEDLPKEVKAELAPVVVPVAADRGLVAPGK